MIDGWMMDKTSTTAHTSITIDIAAIVFANFFCCFFPFLFRPALSEVSFGILLNTTIIGG